MIDGIKNFEPMETPGPTLPGPMIGVDLCPTPITISKKDVSLIPRVIQWPMTVVDATDLMFSHNELIALWYGSSVDGHTRIWIGEAWALPDEYKNLLIKKIIGIVPDVIWQGDTINLEVNADDSTPRDLPKKYNDTSDCSDAEPKRVEDTYHIDKSEIKRWIEIRTDENLIETKDGKYYLETPTGVYANENITKLCIMAFNEGENRE